MSVGASSDRYHHRRPIDKGFYDRLIAALPAGTPVRTTTLEPGGSVVAASSGDIVRITLEEAAQVVLLYAWNPTEPRERVWCQETSSLEGCYLHPKGRLWSKMPWFHALLAMLEDTVPIEDGPDALKGRHHFILDGWETPALWNADGGDPRGPSGWQVMHSLVGRTGADPSLHRDHVALFRKVAVDEDTQRLHVMPSAAAAGDRVTLYAEMDVSIALVPSPYIDDSTPAADIDQPTRPVRIDVWPSGVEPLGWPYPGVPYPEIEPYVLALDEAIA